MTSDGNNSTQLFNGTVCVLISESLDCVGDFMHKVFNCSKIQVHTKPFKHGIINFTSLDDEKSLLLIGQRDCPSYIRETVEAISLKQIHVFVKDSNSVQSLATQNGAQLSESNADGCVLEVPGGLIVNVMNTGMNKTSKGHEIVLNYLQSKLMAADTERQQTQVKRGKSSSPTRIIVPTLKVEIQQMNSQFGLCPPNPKYPIPFETESFKGHALIAIRTEQTDPMYQCFFTGKRLFEVQIQGKFKRKPTGELFVGAETTNKMELGLLTRSVSRGVLQFCGNMISGLQHSFGDDQTSPDFQFPHLVAPWFSSLDKCVITPPGQTPPLIGQPFVEDPEFKKKRSKFKVLADFDIDIDCTYSMSVNSNNLELASWSLTGIPLMKPFDLRPFFGDSSIRLVGYELPRELYEKNMQVHPQKQLNYMFSMKLTKVMSDEAVDMAYDSGSDEEVDDNEFKGTAQEGVHGSTLTVDNIQNHVHHCENEQFNDDEEGDEMDEEDDDVMEMDDDETEAKNVGLFNKIAPKKNFFRSGGNAVTKWFTKHMSSDGKNEELIDILESDQFTNPDHHFETEEDLKYCSACIEVSDGDERKRTTYFYLIPWQLEDGTYIGRLRSYSELVKLFGVLQPIPKLHKNKKISVEEKCRRQIAETYRSALATGKVSAQSVTILMHENFIDKDFLSSSITRSASVVGHSLSLGYHASGEQYEGHVCFARSARHWIERYFTVNKNEICMVKSDRARRSPITISMSSVVSISPCSSQKCPMPQLYGSFGFFEIETATRVYYIMTKTEAVCSEWMTIFRNILGDKVKDSNAIISQSPGSYSSVNFMNSEMLQDQLGDISNSPDDIAYLGRPCDWKLDKRRIYNYRRIHFHSNCAIVSDYLKNNTPIALAEEALQRAFQLSEVTDKSRNSYSFRKALAEFGDVISLFQVVDISKLSEKEKTSFFLNVYHIMVLHGIIVLGPPMAWVNWQTFFRSVSYIIDNEMVSLAELEHNILRAAMTKSSMLFSKTFVPQTVFPVFALKQRDFRLNFCINNGSTSMASSVPIYKPDKLDRQLDDMTSAMLTETVDIDIRKRIVLLPKICSSYLLDFAPKSCKSVVTPLDCLRVLSSYLNTTERQALVKCFAEGIAVSVKFKNFNFSCRRFELYHESVGAGESKQ